MSFFYFFVASYIHRIEPTNAVLTPFFLVVSHFSYIHCYRVGWAVAKQSKLEWVILSCVDLPACAFCVYARSGVHIMDFFPEFCLRFVF